MATSPKQPEPFDRALGPGALSRGISRRSFLLGTGVAIAAAGVASCSPQTPRPTTKSDHKVQLVYQDWRTDWFPAMAQEMLAQFHEKHPNIRVFYSRDPEDVEVRMLKEMESGTAPDVFQGCCDWFPILAQNGYLLDLRPFVSADLDRETIEDWDQAQYRSFFGPGGIQYGLPKYHGALALYYNRDIFDERRVDYPDGSWDHDDYLSAMKRLTRSASGSGRADVWGGMVDVSWERLQMHVNGWGGSFVDPKDARKCLMSEEPAIAALEWLRARMWDDRVMATLDMQKTGTQRAFISGQVATVEDGSWALKEILSRADFKVGVAPFPAGPVRRVTLATSDGFGIYAGTRSPEAAWELMKFLISADYGRAMAKANFLQPARASLVDEWVGYVRNEFPLKTTGMDVAAFADGHIKGYSVTGEIFANMEAAREIAYTAWDQILTLGQSPVDMIRDACRQIQDSQKASGALGPLPCESGCERAPS